VRTAANIIHRPDEGGVRTTETSVNSKETTRRYIPEGSTVHLSGSGYRLVAGFFNTAMNFQVS
jgi:hypothetical protein